VKCTNKKSKFTAFLLLAAISLSCFGCGKNEFPDRYSVTKTSEKLGILQGTAPETGGYSLFSDGLCLPETSDSDPSKAPDIPVTTYSAALFDETSHETLYNYQMLKKVYPASTTKIMTALVALDIGNIDQKITCTDEIKNVSADSSLANLKPGDTLTLKQLLYGLLLPSGNDAAIAIATGLSGSVDAFVEKMNEKAVSLGATGTHYITCNGLPDPDHYTTAYDMYLIFRAALKNKDFMDIISTKEFKADFTSADGSAASLTWHNTNRYFTGKTRIPKGITVIGGKTGTTGEARYCLVQLSRNEEGHDLISCVFGADCAYNLYLDTSELLQIKSE
jgi:D-alanyl-D-alanine carboxypeptidase (penicillin-binding protein 5/6)